MAGACDSVTHLLSPYADEALSGSERARVTGHLEGCAGCQGRLADLQATRSVLGAYFAAQAEGVDFTGFSQRVLGALEKEPLPFGQRLRLAWTELMAYHRAAVYGGFAAAAAVLLAVLALSGGHGQRSDPAGAVPSVIRSLTVSDPSLEPVVLHADDGDTFTILVEHGKDPQSAPPPAPAPHGGNL